MNSSQAMPPIITRPAERGKLTSPSLPRLVTNKIRGMSDNQQIVAGGPWSYPEIDPQKQSQFRLRDAIWIFAAVIALVTAGLALLCLSIWAFFGNGWSP